MTHALAVAAEQPGDEQPGTTPARRRVPEPLPTLGPQLLHPTDQAPAPSRSRPTRGARSVISAAARCSCCRAGARARQR